MGAASLPAVRRAIRSADAGELRALSLAALSDRSAADARARFTALASPE
jgi:hypothetical protein